MKHVFGVEKFKGLLVASTFVAIANCAICLTDIVVAGNLVGPEALAGVNLASPIMSASLFLACLVSVGVGTLYSVSIGRCDSTRATQFFTQGVWTTLILSGALSCAVLLGHDAFICFFGPTSEIAGPARDYLRWIAPVPLLQGLVYLLVTMSYADGDARLAVLANGVLLAGNVVLSVLAVQLGYGTAGCAIGTVVAELLALAILSLHFLRVTNTLRLVRYFSFKDMLRIGVASFGDAAASLCEGLLFFFLNAFAIRLFGSSILPVIGVVTLLWSFLIVVDGVGNALQPVVTVYYGEGNYPAVRKVVCAAVRWSLIEGVVIVSLFCAFAEPLVRLVGIVDPALVEAAVRAVRIVSLAFVFLPFSSLFNSYYMFIEHSFLAGAVTFLSYLVSPVVLIAVGSFFGADGVWAGLSVGSSLGLATALAIVYPVAGSKAFPLLLPPVREGNIRTFDLVLTDEEISDVSRRISQIPGVPMKAALLTEEVFEVVKDRNAGHRVLGEATIDLTDGVKLTLRDDGEIFDITDADQRISSLRTFLVASMMEHHSGKLNLITTGFNRNVFRF